MVDKDPQDTEIFDAIRSAGEKGIDPEHLVAKLIEQGYDMPSVIEALQRTIERGKITLSSDGMVVLLMPELAHAA